MLYGLNWLIEPIAEVLSTRLGFEDNDAHAAAGFLTCAIVGAVLFITAEVISRVQKRRARQQRVLDVVAKHRTSQPFAAMQYLISKCSTPDELAGVLGIDVDVIHKRLARVTLPQMWREGLGSARDEVVCQAFGVHRGVSFGTQRRYRDEVPPS